MKNLKLKLLGKFFFWLRGVLLVRAEPAKKQNPTRAAELSLVLSSLS